MKVVNDTVDCGIALIQNYNSVLTKHEDQKQYVLQIVENQCQRLPNPNKSTLVRNLL